jgi:hypothetical protein
MVVGRSGADNSGGRYKVRLIYFYWGWMDGYLANPASDFVGIAWGYLFLLGLDGRSFSESG